MKKIIFIFIIIQTSIQFVEAQWIKQLSPAHAIRDIEFINRNTGWACGDNFIYKTTNGGKNWINQPNPSTFLIQQIHPVNDSVVYAAGWWNFLKTTNGGENWMSIFSGGPGQGLPVLEGLYFINENTGWMGGNVMVMKTTNGGKSFIDSMRVEGVVQDVYFKNKMEGLASGLASAFFKTTNGGDNWTQIHVITQGSQYNFIRMSFINDSVGYMGGEIVFKTTDFGSSWDSVGTVPFGGEQAYCIEFADENTGYSGGTTGTLFKTTDGGHNWSHQQVSQFGQGFFISIYAYSDSIVWAVGSGKILFTETGGLVSLEQLSSEIPKDFILYQNFPIPFNPETKIKFDINFKGNVKLEIFDMLGRNVSTLIDKKLQTGSYEVSYDMSEMNSGVYFYKLSLESFSKTMKMLLIK